MPKYEPNSKQDCKHCGEEIGFILWGNGPEGTWRHTEYIWLHCDPYDFSTDNKAEPIPPECDCNKTSGAFCAHCGTAEELRDSGILGFNSPAADFAIVNDAADAEYERTQDRLREYNE